MKFPFTTEHDKTIRLANGSKIVFLSVEDRGLMEVLVEGIDYRSVDIIEDIVLDHSFQVFERYREFKDYLAIRIRK